MILFLSEGKTSTIKVGNKTGILAKSGLGYIVKGEIMIISEQPNAIIAISNSMIL